MKYIAENDKRYIIKTVDDYLVYKYVKSSNTFYSDIAFSGVKAYQKLNANSNFYTELSLLDSTLITDSLALWTLFNCRSDEVKCVPTFGYLKTEDSKYFQLATTGNTDITSSLSSNDCDTADDINVLLTGGEICLIGDDTAPTQGAIGTGYHYIMSNVNSNIFTGATGQSTSILIESSSNALTLTNFMDASTIITYNNIKIGIREITSTNNGKLVLYSCTDGGICTETAAGIHVYKLDGDVATEVVLASGHIDSTETENLAMFSCSATGCKQVEGYAKITTHTKHTTEPEDWEDSRTNYFTDEACTSPVAGGATFASPVYAKNSNAAYYISKTGSTATGSEFVEECTADNIGKLTAENELCITPGNAEAFITNASTPNYLVTIGSKNWYVESRAYVFIRTQVTGKIRKKKLNKKNKY